MKMINKLALTTGSILAIASPIAFVVACGGVSSKPPTPTVPEETGLEPRFYTFDIDGVQQDQQSHILASYGIDPMPNPVYTWRAWDEGSQTDFDSTTHPGALKIETNLDLHNPGEYVTTYSLESPFTGTESHPNKNYHMNTKVIDPLDPVKIYEEQTTLNVAVVYTSFADTYMPGAYEDTMKIIVDEGVEILENATGNHIDFDLDVFDQGVLPYTWSELEALANSFLPNPGAGASDPANVAAHSWASEQLFMKNDFTSMNVDWDKYDIILGSYKSIMQTGGLASMAAGNVQNWAVFQQDQYADNVATIGQFAPNLPDGNKKFVSVGMAENDLIPSGIPIEDSSIEHYSEISNIFAHELGHAAGLAGHSGSLLSKTNQDAFVAAGGHASLDVNQEYGDTLSFMGTTRKGGGGLSVGMSPFHKEIVGYSVPSISLRDTFTGDVTIPEYGYAKIHLGTETYSKTDFKNHSLYVAYLSDDQLYNRTLQAHPDNVNGLYIWYGGLNNENTIGESIQIRPYTEANLISFQPGESFTLRGKKVTVNTVAGTEATFTVEDVTTTTDVSYSNVSSNLYSSVEQAIMPSVSNPDFVKTSRCWHCIIMSNTMNNVVDEGVELNIVESIASDYDSSSSPPVLST